MALVVICSIIACVQRMNNQKEQKSGFFVAQDKMGAGVILEWHKTNIVSSDFAVLMKKAWAFARDAYMPVEMDFLKAFPEVVGIESYFAPFEPLFRDGVTHVDWGAAEKIMESILQGHFVFDPAQFPKQVIETFGKDTSIFVAIKEQSTGKMFGFITFLIRANYVAGDVKVMSFAIDVAYQNRGYGKLLMSSILKIIPNVKRIFLSTRVTNTVALNAYHSWGFTIDEKPILDHAFNVNHWTFMEYKTDRSEILEKVAESLIE